VSKSELVDKVLQWTKFRESVTVVGKKSGKRKGKLNIPKLDDANNAGGKHAQDCTIIIVEGDSAKTQAVSGLGVIGRDNFGAFPLRGKMVNVRDAKYQAIYKNAEISNLVQIIGLRPGEKYEDTSGLRYGHVMIMTDQVCKLSLYLHSLTTEKDYDGSHIKGLLINFIHFFWPSLLRLPGFLTEFITPIVRVSAHSC
jgi:DNA topoisomerase-2